MTLDHDADGDQDILIFNNEGGMSLFCNDLAGPGRNWLRIFLDTGTTPGLAPNGYGSLVTVSIGRRWCSTATWTAAPTTSAPPSCRPTSASAPRPGAEEVRVRWADGEVTRAARRPRQPDHHHRQSHDRVNGSTCMTGPERHFTVAAEERG